MKTVLTMLLILGVSTISSANLVEQWNFGSEGNFSSITTYNYDGDGSTPPTPRHIGGATISAQSYQGWDQRASEGSSLNTSAPAAAGSSRFGITSTDYAALGNGGTATNAFYGATNFQGVPWAANAGALPDNHATSGEYYVGAAAQNETVILTMKITGVDFSQTTGNSNNNANFGFRLWDKASGMQAGGNSNYFMGLTVLDTYDSDRLQLALMSSNGTILEGGTGLTTQKNRTRIGWLTGANGELATDTDYTFTLALDLAAGAWSAQIDDQEAVDGLFDTSHIVGIDRYQAAFQQFSNEDYIDIDEISVSVIPEPATIGLLAGVGSSMIWIRRRFIG